MRNRAGRHTDTEHEWVYDRTPHVDKLEALSVANVRGWVVATGNAYYRSRNSEEGTGGRKEDMENEK